MKRLLVTAVTAVGIGFLLNGPTWSAKEHKGPKGAELVSESTLESQVIHTTDGAIAEIHVTESSGYPLPDQAAIEAVRNTSPLTLRRPLNHARVSVEIPIARHRHD